VLFRSKNRDMTDKQLAKEIRSNKILQLLMLAVALMFASFIVFVPFKQLAPFEQMAFLGVVTSGIAMSFAFYAQYRIFEAEANFEQRLREIVKDVKDWQP